MASFVHMPYNIAKDVGQGVFNAYEFLKRLHDRFRILENEVKTLESLKKDIEEEARRKEITHKMTNQCTDWLDQTNGILKRFPKMKTRYEEALKKPKDDSGNGEATQTGDGSNGKESQNEDGNNGEAINENGDGNNREAINQNGDGSNGQVNQNGDGRNGVANQNGDRGIDQTGVARKLKNPKRRVFKNAILRMDIDEFINEVDRVKKKEPKNFLTAKRPEEVESMIADDINDLPILCKKMGELLGLLEDPSVRTIGIYGPPGVGITPILKNVKKKLKQIETCVIMEKVGKEENAIRKIQKAIARELELPLRDDDSNEKVANILSAALKERRYLLILYEVYSHIKLTDLGITDDQEHGKVVIAAMNKHVIKKINPDEHIIVERLSDGDAWNLFRKYAGDIIDDRRIKDIAFRILQELGGLPPAIKALGVHLKDKRDEIFWNNIMVEVQSPIESDDVELQELVGVYTAYKLVYQSLSPDRQKCVLYGSLFPQDYTIFKDYLIESWRSERFIPDIRPVGAQGNRHLHRAARDKGHEILQCLTDTCLLDWSTSTMEYVKMPGLFRKVAIKLKYPQEGGGGGGGSKVLVRAGEALTLHPVDEEWVGAKRVSLMCNNLESLPAQPECPDISALLLHQNPLLDTIGDSFFGRMQNLQVLDLSSTGIVCLPVAVCSLCSLKGLYLRECVSLSALPGEITELENLEVLDLCGTAIQCLPTGIKSLVKLRCFRFSFRRNNDNSDPEWVIIPPDIVKALTNLEELTVVVDPVEQSWNLIADGIAREVASLEGLTTLSFYFPSVDSLGTFISGSSSWKNINTPWGGQIFRSFNIRVGNNKTHHPHDRMDNRSTNSAERHLKLSIGESATPAIREVLNQATTFELIDHVGAQNLSDFGMENMEVLELCFIGSCNNMVSVVADNIEQGSFTRLTTLTLNGCPELTKILPSGMSNALPELQHLRVQNCPRISIIIKGQHGEIVIEQGNPSGAVLSELKKLDLVNLPMLVGICENTSLDWQSLEKIEIRQCQSLRNLSFTTTSAQKLKLIECSEEWWQWLPLAHEVRERLNRHCRFIR